MSRPASLLDSVDHVQIPVRDLSRAAHWYADTLGFTIQGIGGDGDDQAFLLLPNGPLLCLWETEAGSHSHFTHRGGPRPSLFLKVNPPGIRAIHDRLVAAGATIGLKPDSWEYGAGVDPMKFVMFHDPDGNYLGLIECSGAG
jgi:catechol 2,3-dioxygenase-like lactoylglutathione lyase family enzyme